MTYKIKNWGRFQHYKTRRPPWIKLHRTLLDDCTYLRLQTASRALAPLIWLLASESDDASVPGDHTELAFRLRIDKKEVDDGIKGLLASGYIECLQDASAMLATCKQNLTTETETETENKHHLSDFIGRDDDDSKTSTDGCHEQPKTAETSDAKEGRLSDPGVQIPKINEKIDGKGLETQMQGKPEKPRKVKKAVVYGQEVMAIYEAYPKKVGRAAALAAITAAIRIRGHTAGALLEATKVYATSPMVQTTEPRFIPHPKTWFNQDRFLDDRATWNQVRSNGSERQGVNMPEPWERDIDDLSDEERAAIFEVKPT